LSVGTVRPIPTLPADVILALSASLKEKINGFTNVVLAGTLTCHPPP